MCWRIRIISSDTKLCNNITILASRECPLILSFKSGYQNSPYLNYQQLNQQWELEIPSTIMEEESFLEQPSVQDHATINTDSKPDDIHTDNEEASTTNTSLQSTTTGQPNAPIKLTYNGITIEESTEQVSTVLQLLQGHHSPTTTLDSTTTEATIGRPPQPKLPLAIIQLSTAPQAFKATPTEYTVFLHNYNSNLPSQTIQSSCQSSFQLQE